MIQLEFSILQLTQRLDELTNAIQYVVMGSLPANLINPTTLYNILKKVSFHLPENYELIAGTRVENINFYYKFVKAAAIANSHYITIILNMPMKTAGRHFVLHRIITLPTRILNDTFVLYLPELPYFGIDNIQRNYILFTQAELSYCSINSISTCPAHIPIFNNRLISCESSLFFQTADSHNLCQRKILLKHTTPLLYRYGSSWIFHLPGNQMTTLRCHTNNGSTTYTRNCKETGLLLMRQLVYLPQTNSKRHRKYWVPHNLHSTLQEYMYQIGSPSPRTRKYKKSKKQSTQKSNASATSRPDSQRPAELLICTPFSARVEPCTAMNNDPTGT